MTNEASCSCCLSSSPTKSIMKLAWISRLSSFPCLFLWAALSMSVSEAVDRHDVNPSLKGRRCGRSGDGKMSYTWGDALSLEASGESDVDCIGPDGQRYPTELVDKLARSMSWAKSANSVGNHRQGRSQSMEVQDPLKTRDMLLRFHHQQPSDFMPHDRKKRATHVVIRDDPSQGKLGNDVEQTADTYQKQEQQQSQCGSSTAGHPPARLCQSRYNTTAPMFGVSLTSGRTVTIVQKFPDLLQQVVFEVCESKECDVLRGECVQTYVPYLFLVIPLGPVTLTGQDYVLVESGCVCRPKYGVHVPQTLDSYFQPPLPTKAPANSSADIDDESLP